MIIHDTLTDLFGCDGPATTEGLVIYECRHCGTKFDEKPRQCSACESAEIATYELSQADDLCPADEPETENESSTVNGPNTANEPGAANEPNREKESGTADEPETGSEGE